MCSSSVTHTYKLAQQLSFTVLLKENEKLFFFGSEQQQRRLWAAKVVFIGSAKAVYGRQQGIVVKQAV